MKSPDFEAKAHGKWILTGEHAVLRGYPALVFPVKSKTMTLSYKSNPSLKIMATDESIAKKIQALLKSGLKLLNKNNETLSGEFEFTNSIPIASGMGSSSALCVIIAKWFLWKEWINKSELFQFTLQLENLIHGSSSGVDIIGALSTSGQYYIKEKRI